jgi:hypothetical protein
VSKRAITSAPCKHCPFRKDVPIYLRSGRRDEIADTLRRGVSFPCHETVSHEEMDDDEYVADTGGAVECAGALKALMADGGTTQLARIAERLGLADLDKTGHRGADCWALSDWTRLAEGSTGDEPEWEVGDEDGVDVETCNTVNDGCLAPAGYLTASGAVEHGTEAADLECPCCGEPVCSNCADEQGRCGSCSEWDYEVPTAR